jgi:putative ABC transport system ATP-binding protein
MVQLECIVKNYGKGSNIVSALKGISLQINQGEFVAITGPSGCGKSTLLNIVGGMDKQSEGTYHYQNISIENLNTKDLATFRNQKIGFIFQAYHLSKELTVLDNVALPLGYAGVAGRERKERAKALLKKVDLTEKIKTYPTKLSGGEMQRVAIARALANHPSILLADEPTGNLDQENGLKIMSILKEINQEGTTIVLVTHDLALAKCADRVVQMKDGNITI